VRGGKNLEVFSPAIGRQLLQLRLIDGIDLHIAPIPLGEVISLYDNPGVPPIRLEGVGDGTPTSASTFAISYLAPKSDPGVI
jgi:hypothetical protein